MALRNGGQWLCPKAGDGSGGYPGSGACPTTTLGNGHVATNLRLIVRACTGGGAAAPSWLGQSFRNSQLHPCRGRVDVSGAPLPDSDVPCRFIPKNAARPASRTCRQSRSHHRNRGPLAVQWSPPKQWRLGRRAHRDAYSSSSHDARPPEALPGFSRVTSTLAGIPPLANLYSLSPSPMIAGC